MKVRLSLLLPLVLLGAAPGARADIYKCVDEAGHITYTNSKQGKGCSVLSRDQPVSSVPAPRAPAAGGGSASGGSPAAGTSGFPRVEPGVQRARDGERRRILDEELAAEQRGLAAAQKELAEQEEVRYGNERNYQRVLDRLQPFKDKVQLHERNIEALRREIGNLR